MGIYDIMHAHYTFSSVKREKDMKNVIRRVFARKDTYVCFGIILLGILCVCLAYRLLPEKLVTIVQMFFSIFTMSGAFMFSRIVQEEYAIEEANNKSAKGTKKKR